MRAEGDDGLYDIQRLRERVICAEAQRSCAEMRAASPPRTRGCDAPVAATLELYASTAEQMLREQSNQLQLQLEASYQRVHLLERRVHERQVTAARPRVRGGCLRESTRGRLTAFGKPGAIPALDIPTPRARSMGGARARC